MYGERSCVQWEINYTVRRKARKVEDRKVTSSFTEILGWEGWTGVGEGNYFLWKNAVVFEHTFYFLNFPQNPPFPPQYSPIPPKHHVKYLKYPEISKLHKHSILYFMNVSVYFEDQAHITSKLKWRERRLEKCKYFTNYFHVSPVLRTELTTFDQDADCN